MSAKEEANYENLRIIHQQPALRTGCWCIISISLSRVALSEQMDDVIAGNRDLLVRGEAGGCERLLYLLTSGDGHDWPVAAEKHVFGPQQLNGSADGDWVKAHCVYVQALA